MNKKSIIKEDWLDEQRIVSGQSLAFKLEQGASKEESNSIGTDVYKK